jgi:hypothetical protein
LVATHRYRIIGKWVPAQGVERRTGSGWRLKETMKLQEEERQANTEGSNEMRKWSRGFIWISAVPEQEDTFRFVKVEVGLYFNTDGKFLLLPITQLDWCFTNITMLFPSYHKGLFQGKVNFYKFWNYLSGKLVMHLGRNCRRRNLKYLIV